MNLVKWYGDIEKQYLKIQEKFNISESNNYRRINK